MSVHLFNQASTVRPGKNPDGIVVETLAELAAGAIAVEPKNAGQMSVETCDLAAELWGIPTGIWQRLCTAGDLLVIDPGDVMPAVLMAGTAAVLHEQIQRLMAAYQRDLFPLTLRWLVALHSLHTCVVAMLRAVPQARVTAPPPGDRIPVGDLLDVIRYAALFRWAADATLKAERAAPQAETPDAPPTEADE